MLTKRNVIIVIAVIIVVWMISLVAMKIMVPDKNPSQRYTGMILSQNTDGILKRSCFNCHSNETVWPWYSYAPVISMLVASDVSEARDHMNFSKWDQIPENSREFDLKLIVKELESGDMPPFIYQLGHSDAKVSDAELSSIRQAVEERGSASSEKADQ